MSKKTARSETKIKLCIRLICLLGILTLAWDAVGQDRDKFQVANSGCSRIWKDKDLLFITVERNEQPSKGKQNVVVLRLHNNSTCAVIVTSGSAEKFLKPLPGNPTAMQRLKPEIDYVLPDDAFVPELQYQYNAKGKDLFAIGGDSFFGFQLPSARSILFEVAEDHLGRAGVGNMIAVPFQYVWQAQDQSGNIYPSVESRVVFWTDSLDRKRVE